MSTNEILIAIYEYLPKNHSLVHVLKDELESLNDSQRQSVAKKLSLVELKNPNMIFWVCSCLNGFWGLDRFFIGDTVRGVLKVLIYILMISSLLLFFAIVALQQKEILMLFGSIFLLLFLINIVWWSIDIYLVSKKYRKMTLQKILNLINEERA